MQGQAAWPHLSGGVQAADGGGALLQALGLVRLLLRCVCAHGRHLALVLGLHPLARLHLPHSSRAALANACMNLLHTRIDRTASASPVLKGMWSK